MAISLGDTIPVFSAEATCGEMTSDMFKGRYTVLYFYPKDNTSGCTMEGRDFAALYDQFKSEGCEVIGVSRDSVKSHNNFCAKQGFPFALISDKEESLCRAFDVMKLKKLYGREPELCANEILGTQYISEIHRQKAKKRYLKSRLS